MIFLALVHARSWAFATKDELDLKCTACQRIVKAFKANSSIPSDPTAGSRCALQPNSKFCAFLQSVISELPTVSNLSGYCRNTQACPAPPPSHYAGRCETCVGLVGHLLIHKPPDRKKAFFEYCRTNNPAVLGFCGDWLDDKLKTLLESLTDFSSALEFCKRKSWCRSRSDEL
jgi:hypothetical protein